MGSMSFAQLQEIAKQSDISFEVLPAGEYLGKVIEVGTDPASTGKDMFTVKFEVTQGPRAGAKLWTRIVISPENPNSVAFLFKNLAAFGIGQDVLQHEPSMAQVAGMMMDKLVWLKVGIKPYQGEDRNEIKGMKAYEGGAQATMSAQQIDPFTTAAAPSVTQAPAAPVHAPVAAPFPAVTAPVPTPQPLPSTPPAPPAPPMPPASPAVPAMENSLPAPPF